MEHAEAPLPATPTSSDDPTELLLAGGGEAVAALAVALERARPARRVRVDGPAGAGHRLALAHLTADGPAPPLELWAERPGALAALAAAGPGGTVCLRRVDRLAAEDQAALARALAGGDPLPRLISTVERAPDGGADGPAGELDPDLDYLLAGRTVLLPPLAARLPQLDALARAAVARAARDLGRDPLPLTPAALDHLRRLPWTGELEELELTLRLALVRAAGRSIDLRELGGVPAPAAPSPLGRTLAEVERDHLDAVLRAVGQNRARAARELGINRSTLYNKLRARAE